VSAVRERRLGPCGWINTSTEGGIRPHATSHEPCLALRHCPVMDGPARALLLPRACDRFEDQSRYVAEDAVVGDEGDVEPNCGGRDPTVAIVLALAERVPNSLAVNSESCVSEYEIWP
jgi:hypothetical protein